MAFEAKPEVIANIRPMALQDVPRVAFLHHAAMGNSLWAQLGLRFLREIYRGLLTAPQFLGFVYEEEGQIEGFIAGSTNTSTMMRRVFLRRAPRLGLAALLGLREPSIALKLLGTAKYFKESNHSLNISVPAESLFCSFTPKLRGKRISGHINKVLFDTLYFQGHHRVKITMETSNQGANRQLLSWGFISEGTFEFYGKEMITYVLDLAQSDRVEKQNWVKDFKANAN